ncbi:MAG: hypothetical protein IKK70_03870 [Clostridia bacterium]|nr:hypothetical protein [Clostridia bacterium]
MKPYKLFLLILIILALAVSLSSCIIIPLTEYYDFSVEEVVSVQFYDLRDPEAYRYSGFDASIEPVYTVSEEDKEEFLEDFSELKFSDAIVIVLAAVDPSFNYDDWVVRINFSNGQYTFYSSSGYGETFDAEGNRVSSTHFGCDDEDLEALVGKYYQTE